MHRFVLVVSDHLYRCKSLNFVFGLIGFQKKILWWFQTLPGLFPVQPEDVHFNFTPHYQRLGRRPPRRTGWRFTFGLGRWRRYDFEFDFRLVFFCFLQSDPLKVGRFAFARIPVGQSPVIVPLRVKPAGKGKKKERISCLSMVGVFFGREA